MLEVLFGTSGGTFLLLKLLRVRTYPFEEVVGVLQELGLPVTCDPIESDLTSAGE